MRGCLDFSHVDFCPSSPPFLPPPSLLIHPSFYLLFSTLFPPLFSLPLSPYFPPPFPSRPPFFLLSLPFHHHHPSFLSPSTITTPPSSPLPPPFLSPRSLPPSSFSPRSRSPSPQMEPLLKPRSGDTATKNEVGRKQFISVCWNKSASGYLGHV